ncbi:MAG: cytochrome c3 family protein [Pseudomonadota bacterium]
MAFLIRTIDFTSSGREIVRERNVYQASLFVGRAAENDIHLPDLAVEQQHIRIDQGADGSLQVEAVGTLGFELDGRTQMSAAIDPSTGAEIELGSSRLTIAQETQSAVSITIKQAEEKGSKVDALAGFELASALPSKRAMAWVFSLAILVLLLSVPIITHLTREKQDQSQSLAANGAMVDQVSFDSTWSSGELSLAHHDLKDNCEACHATPFVSVQDETCLTCHEELGEHAKPARLKAGMAPIPTTEAWQWAVAETLGKEGPGSCTSCHLEHEGKVRQQAATQQFCADCHDALDKRLSNVSFGNADNFGDKHPQFRPTFYTAYKQENPVRVSLDTEGIEEKSGLIFPHDSHMDPNGGVARMAISLPGYGEELECASCHEPDDDRIGYKPVEMEPACEACHSLVFDQVGGEFRSLKHGKVDELRADLMRMTSGPRSTPRSNNPTGRKRPGQFASGGTYAVDFGRPTRSLISINRALMPDGVCGDCHLPTKTKGRPDVMPVNLPDRYMQHGFFSHAAHEEEKCTDCHEATTSKSATDLLLPDLESCRDCHIGEVLTGPGAPAGLTKVALKEDEVPSTCAMCHGYHTPTNPWPGDHPILQSTPEGMRGRGNGAKGNGGRKPGSLKDSIASLSALLKD